MYICEDCGTVFSETDFFVSRDYFWGSPFDSRSECCPHCSSEDYGEAKECEVCGEYYGEEDLISGVCEECIDKCRHDIDTCAEIGEESKEDVKINSFLLHFFDPKEIEEVLLDKLKADQNTDCSPFIDHDVTWFAEQLVAQGVQL